MGAGAPRSGEGGPGMGNATHVTGRSEAAAGGRGVKRTGTVTERYAGAPLLMTGGSRAARRSGATPAGQWDTGCGEDHKPLRGAVSGCRGRARRGWGTGGGAPGGCAPSGARSRSRWPRGFPTLRGRAARRRSQRLPLCPHPRRPPPPATTPPGPGVVRLAPPIIGATVPQPAAAARLAQALFASPGRSRARVAPRRQLAVG